MKTPALRLLVLTSLACIVTRADDWPQWRGPNRDGISKETGLLKEWPKEGPRLIWEAQKVGGGFSSVAVVGGMIFTIGNDGLENESVRALSAKDGKELWARRIGKVGKPDQRPSYPAARSTPTVDGAFVYALGSDGDLVCLEKEKGAVKWHNSLLTEFAGAPGTWAYAESPLVDGDAVVCTPGGPKATLLALNKKDGSVIWKSVLPGGEESGYSSIVIVETDGLKQYVQFLQKGVVGVAAKDGNLLWRYDRPAQGSPANIPTPVAWKNYVYAGSGRGGGLVKLTVEDGKVTPEPVYFTPKAPTAIGGALKMGENLYGATGGALLCLDYLSGKLHWEDRALGAASLLFADGCLYLHGENGEVALVEATPDGYQERGRFKPTNIPDHGSAKAWAYPAVANGRLYIRDSGTLWCYDVAGK